MAEGRNTTRFGARIALERRFLTPVNLKVGEYAPLAGMTSDAIKSWKTRATVHFGSECVAAVAEILTEVARRAMLLVDDSREVFDLAIRTPTGIDELFETLLQRLQAVTDR